jgi:hypothetical protein
MLSDDQLEALLLDLNLRNPAFRDQLQQRSNLF